MRRSPFYPYSHLPRSFYMPHAETAHHRPRRPSPPSTPPTPAPRSVINIPVFDSAASWPSSSPSQPHSVDPHSSSPPALNSPSVPLIDPSSAATIIQSHFRGFCVRRHRPLLHLCSIAKARKQLEDLQSELESPGFALKVRASEKERLRFSESVMAIILRLDAIEGSLQEVRSQRKEATKMAIKLQDAVDAIMMQKDEFVDLNPTDIPLSEGGMVPDDDDVLHEQSKEVLCSDVNTVGHAVSEEGIMDANAMEEESISPEVDVSDKCMPSLDKDDVIDMLDENVLTLGVERIDQQKETDYFEPIAQAKAVETMYDAKQYIAGVTGENVGGDASHASKEVVNNGIGALHLLGHKDHIQENVLVAIADHDLSVPDTIVANGDLVKAGASDGSCTCMDVVEEVEGGLNQDVEFCPGTPTVKEECDDPQFNNAEHQSQLQRASTAFEIALAEDDCSSDRRGCPVPHQQACKMSCDRAHENRCSRGNSCDKLKVTSSSQSEVEAELVPDSDLLHQLSEDCRQLKSLVGKLLAQNKAQSKVLCALGERLELLEHQHRQNILKKRKSKKGSKRSVKCRDFE